MKKLEWGAVIVLVSLFVFVLMTTLALSTPVAGHERAVYGFIGASGLAGALYGAWRRRFSEQNS